jgi:uncharacterized oxidoreductase
MVTNPYCCTVPRANGDHLVLDFATSFVAIGKLRVAFMEGKEVPEGALVDAEGRATTDPRTFFRAEDRSLLLPFGLHKGGGMQILCEILGGALAGHWTMQPGSDRAYGAAVNNMLSIIIDPASMGGTAFFEDEVETFITWVKSAKPQSGVPEVLAPGEPERARRVDREKNGVPIDTTTWQQLLDIARKVRLNDTDIPSIAGA